MSLYAKISWDYTLCQEKDMEGKCMKNGSLSRGWAELLLAGVITARSTSYLFSKLILAGMGVFNLLGVRFILASVILIVPLLQAVLKHCLPRRNVILSCILSLAGVACLKLGSGVNIGTGEIFCLLAAFLYACTIIMTDRLAHGGIDTLAAGIVQVCVIGVLSLTSGIIFEEPRLPSGTLEWSAIIMLAVVCTGFGFTLQPVAQSKTTAERAGMFCALNPLVATALGIVFLHEQFTVQSAIGGAFILAGILIAELPETKDRKKEITA